MFVSFQIFLRKSFPRDLQNNRKNQEQMLPMFLPHSRDFNTFLTLLSFREDDITRNSSYTSRDDNLILLEELKVLKYVNVIGTTGRIE